MKGLPLAVYLCETIQNGHSIALLPSEPAWAVLNKMAVSLLQACCPSSMVSEGYRLLQIQGDSFDSMVTHLRAQTGLSFAVCEHCVQDLLRQLPKAHTPLAKRRQRQAQELKELWLHLTDACNLHCSHCLFSEDLKKGRMLNPEDLLNLIKQACDLGAGLICFTGGEPLLYANFFEIVSQILRQFPVKIAVLTNGTLIPHQLQVISGLNRDRIYFQISLDGPSEIHDAIRGKGRFDATLQGIHALQGLQMPFGIATAVNSTTLLHLRPFLHLLAANGIQNLHLMWHFFRGNGRHFEAFHAEDVVQILMAFQEAESLGIVIDNLTAIEAQVFSPIGTAFGTGNGGWESLAVGPDGFIYATPAQVDRRQLQVGHIKDGLKQVWLHGEGLQKLRSSLQLQPFPVQDDPWRPLLGIGDLDHMLTDLTNGISLKKDPYYSIQKALAIWAIEKETKGLKTQANTPQIVLRMGDLTAQCPSSAEINFTHCNCLLSIGSVRNQQLIASFYAQRAQKPDANIRNPVKIQESNLQFIPEKALLRMYGCGSPVIDAQLQPGETLLDLGCGTGVECFIALQQVGKTGMVYGLDMLPDMLQIANEAKAELAKHTNCNNVHFIQGDMSAIPLPDASVDVVISNCVINLTRNKRQVFSEIWRVLKPGGRMVISDVVTETEPPLQIRSHHGLAGECIAGALVQDYLCSVLQGLGFIDIQLLKRFPYRQIQDHTFHSLTFRAFKPSLLQTGQRVLYAGPGRALLLNDTLLATGLTTEIASNALSALHSKADYVFLLNAQGSVTNLSSSATPCCSIPQADFISDSKEKPCDCTADQITHQKTIVHSTGCLICGAEIQYFTTTRTMVCAVCQRTFEASSCCKNGHFVCDTCHITEPIEVIREVCLTSQEKDMISLMQQIRAHRRFPIHGPEHHAMVPAIILTAYKNAGGGIDKEHILTAIERGGKVPGGACGYMGICGAAIGVGIAFSILLQASPLTPSKRQQVQGLVNQTLAEIAGFEAARCCQRESYLALKAAERLSKTTLAIQLQAQSELVCRQFSKNRECIGTRCPLHVSNRRP